jgi:hypothetical protein
MRQACAVAVAAGKWVKIDLTAEIASCRITLSSARSGPIVDLVLGTMCATAQAACPVTLSSHFDVTSATQSLGSSALRRAAQPSVARTGPRQHDRP